MRPTLPSLRPRPLDLLAPAVVLVVGLVELAGIEGAPVRWPAFLLEGLGCAALVWRRQLAIPVAVIAVACMTLLPLTGPHMQDVATPILVAMLASWSTARWVRDYWGLLGIAGIVLVI